MDLVFATINIFLLLHCALGEKITDIDVAKQFLADFNERAMDLFYSSTEAAWMFNTNLTEENQRKLVSTWHWWIKDFSVGWRQSSIGGGGGWSLAYYLRENSRKLHESEKKLDPEEGRTFLAHPPPRIRQCVCHNIKFSKSKRTRG